MIVVLGSINADLVARVSALPREGETQLATGYAVHAGGKGANQALAARRAGADVALFGAVGRDGFAYHAEDTGRHELKEDCWQCTETGNWYTDNEDYVEIDGDKYHPDDAPEIEADDTETN